MAPFRILPPHSEVYHAIQNPTIPFRSLLPIKIPTAPFKILPPHSEV